MDAAAKDAEGAQKRNPLEDLSKEDLIKKCKNLLVIAQRAKQAKDEAGEEVRNLKERLKALEIKCEQDGNGSKNGNLEWKEKELQLESQVSAMQEMLATLTEQKLHFTMEIDSLKKQNALLEKQLNQLKEDENNIKTASMQLQCRIDELETAAESYKRQNNRLTNENEALIQQMDSLEVEMRKKEQTSELSAAQEHDLKNQLQALQDEVERLTEEDVRKKEQMKQLYETFSKEKSELESRLESDRNTQTVEIQKLTEELEVMGREKEVILIDLKSVKENNNELEKLIQSISAEREAYSSQVAKLNEEKITIGKHLELIGAENKTILDENRNLKSNNQRLSELLETVNKEIGVIRSENSLLKAEKQEFNEELHHVINERDTLSSEVRNAESQLQNILHQTLSTLQQYRELKAIDEKELVEVEDTSSGYLYSVISSLNKTLSEVFSFIVSNINMRDNTPDTCCKQVQVELQNNATGSVNSYISSHDVHNNECQAKFSSFCHEDDNLTRLYSEINVLSVIISNIEAQGEFLQAENSQLKESVNYLLNLLKQSSVLISQDSDIETHLRNKSLIIEESTFTTGSEFDTMKSCHNGSICKCSEDILQLQKEHKIAQENIETKTAELEKLGKKIRDLEKSLVPSEIEMELRNELNHCRQTLNKKSTELSLAQEELSFALGQQKEFGSGQKIIEKLRNDLIHLEKCLEEKDRELTHAKEELSQISQLFHNSQFEKERSNAELSKKEEFCVDNSTTRHSNSEINCAETASGINQLNSEMAISEKKFDIDSNIYEVSKNKEYYQNEDVVKQDILLGCSVTEQKLSVPDTFQENLIDFLDNENSKEDIVKKLNDKIQALQHKLTDAYILVERSNVEVEALQEKINQYEKEKTNFGNDNMNTNSSINGSKVKDNSIIIKDEVCKFDEINRENKGLNEENVKLNEDIKLKSMLLEEKQKIIESIEIALEDIEITSETDKNELQERILKLVIEIQNYKFILDERNVEIESLKEELENTKINFSRIAEEAVEVSPELEAMQENKDREIDTLKATLLQTESNLAETLVKFSAQETEFSHAQSLIKNLKMQIFDTDKLIEEKQAELSNLILNFEEKCTQLNIITKLAEDRALELENLKIELQEAQKTHSEKVNALNAQLSKLQECYEEKCLEYGSVSELLKDATLELETLRVELQNFQEAQKSHSEKGNELNAQLSKLQECYEEKCLEYDNVTKLLKDSTLELETLRVELHNFQEAQKTHSEKENELNAQLSKLKECYEEKCLEYDNVSKLLKDSTLEIESLRVELQNFQKMSSETEAEFRKKLIEADSNYDDSVKEMFCLTKQLEEYTLDKAKVQSEFMYIQRHYIEKIREIEDLTKEVHSLQSYHSETQDELRLARNQYNDVLKELECLKNELHVTNEEHEKMEEELRIAREQCVDKAKDLESLSSELVNVQNASAEAFARLSAITAELDSVKDAHLKSTAALEKMTDQLRDAATHLELQEEDLQDKIVQLQDAKRSVDLLQSKNQQMAVNVRSLSSQVCDLNALQKELLKDVRILQTDVLNTLHKDAWDKIQQALMSYVETEISSAKRENSELLVEMNEMNQVIKQRGETISKLKELNNEMEQRLKEKTSKLEATEEELKTKLILLDAKEKSVHHMEQELVKARETHEQDVSLKDETIHSLEREVMKFMECQHELETKTSALEAKEEAIHNLEAELIKQADKLQELKSKDKIIHNLEEELTKLKGTTKLDSEDKNEASSSDTHNHRTKELEEEISLLKSKIQQLERESEEMRKENGDVQSEAMSSSTISKAEESARLRDLEETFEERYTKLRIVAVRLKKKVSELTAQQTQLEADKKKLAGDKADLQAKITQLSAQAKNMQTIQQEYDRLQDELETQKSEVKELTRTLESAITESTNIKMQLQECQEQKEQKVKDLELCTKEKQNLEIANKELSSQVLSLKKEKEAENMAKKEREKEFKKLEEDLKIGEKRLAEEVEHHKNTQDQLEASRQECKKRSVLSLEMEDYERSLADLTQQLAAEKSKVKETDTHLETQRDISRGLQEQISLLEQRILSEETRSKEVKEQLNASRTRLAEAEALALEREQSIAELSSQIEQHRDKNENLVLQLSELAAEKQRLVESGRNQQDSLSRQVHVLEEHVSRLRETLGEREAELEALRAEFGNYKVRAQSVLRQKARPEDATSSFSREDYIEELTQLRQTTEILKTKLEDASSKLQTVTVENNAIQEDRARVLQRCQELIETVQELRTQNSQLQTQLQDTAAEHREMLRSQKLQAETLNQCYKQQLEEMEERLHKETSSLKKQLKDAENELQAFRQHPSSAGSIPFGQNSQSGDPNVTPNKHILTSNPHWSSSSSGFVPVRNPASMSQQESENRLEISLLEREEGEGSESVDSTSPHLTSSQEHRSEPIPLDKLLSSPPDDESNVLSSATTGASPSAEFSRIKEQLIVSECRIKHLTGLLSETERDLAKLTQQNQVLKEEIRRQQRSVEREQHAQNFEYLKNVVLKFVTLQGGDERSRLVPVLNTILKLSPEETNQLNIVAKGGAELQGGGRGWGSYLQMWSGTQ